MRRVKRCFLAAMCAFMLCSSQLVAASKPPSFSVGEHLVAVVPMTGAGTYQDPRRPLFAPTPSELAKAGAAGEALPFTFVHFQPSDDGQYAIVEFVANDRKALESILRDKVSIQVAFNPETLSEVDAETQLKRFRRNFNLKQFHGVPTAAVQAGVGGAQ